MHISVEISKYPLQGDYGTPILGFIERIRGYAGVSVKSNTMSTQIFGPYDLIMDLLKNEIKPSFESEKTVVFVLKLVNEDLSE